MGPICPGCEQTLAPDALDCPDCGLSWDPDLRCLHHPDREAGARCAVCRDPLCEDCRKRRNFRYLCRDHADLEVIDGHVDVKKVSSPVEAQLLRGLLESAGIPTWIHSQKDSAYVTNFGALTPVKILVPRDRLDEARAVLADADRSAFALGAACPECGRSLDDTADGCPDCAARGHST